MSFHTAKTQNSARVKVWVLNWQIFTILRIQLGVRYFSNGYSWDITLYFNKVSTLNVSHQHGLFYYSSIYILILLLMVRFL